MMNQACHADVTVVVITVNRPEYLRRCMKKLRRQTLKPSQIIVVDSSHNDQSLRVMESFPEVLYISAPENLGRMTASRNRALLEARGKIIAFLDDDAYAHADWLENLLTAYDRPNVGGVGGRALNGQADEWNVKANKVGVLTRNGFLLGNFSANTGKSIDVEHLIGCNMSFLREVLERLGGFRENFSGTSSVCEDSDFCLRVRSLGYTLRFQPAAQVDHVGAPQLSGKRFNAVYLYHQRSNSCVMLIRRFGCSRILLRYPLAIMMQTGRNLLRQIGGAFACFAGASAGIAVGMFRGLYVYLREGTDPIRRDAGAEAIRKALRRNAALSTTKGR